MTCKELVEAVTDYLDGALPPRESRALRGAHRHLPALPYASRPDALVGAVTGAVVHASHVPVARRRSNTNG